MEMKWIIDNLQEIQHNLGGRPSNDVAFVG